MNPDRAEYYEIVLCYVDDVLAISGMPMIKMDGIRSVLKLKDDKTEVPDLYLGTTFRQVENETGTKCCSMSSKNYVKAEIDNIKSNLGKSDMHLPKFRTPVSTSYHPSEDVTKELNVESVQLYQGLIRILRWAVKIGRVNILLEVSRLSSHLALPRIRHIQTVYHTFG